jgi:hypothetical protein
MPKVMQDSAVSVYQNHVGVLGFAVGKSEPELGMFTSEYIRLPGLPYL